MLKNCDLSFPTTMNDTNHASTHPHQWFQYYQQTTASANQSVITATGGSGPGFSEGNSTVVTTSFTANNTSSSNNSTSIGSTSDHHAHLSLQGSAGKPIRRRSRASRRTPTTLLNASTTNFRALVQQFTGCQNTKTSSLGSQKGPVNLSFEKPIMTTTQNDHQILGTSSRITPLESSYIYDQVHQQQQKQMFEKLQINENDMQSGGLDDFVIDDVSDFHELVDESSSFSTENNMGGNYYF